MSDFPNVDQTLLNKIDRKALFNECCHDCKPNILLLYGSLRDVSYSRLAVEEAGRLLSYFGANVKQFNPEGLPSRDLDVIENEKVQELRELVNWSDGMMWSSPELHGAMSGLMKTQIDWIPLSEGGIRPTQGKTLALIEVTGGSQSYNALNQMRIIGRWMRMLTIPNQSSIPKAWLEFDENGRMKPSSLYDRLVDVCEEMVKFSVLTCQNRDYLVDRYSERKETEAEFRQRIDTRTVTGE